MDVDRTNGQQRFASRIAGESVAESSSKTDIAASRHLTRVTVNPRVGATVPQTLGHVVDPH